MSVRPGCRVELPDEPRADGDARYNASPECLRLSGGVTVLDVAMASTVPEHIDRVRTWGRAVWAAWGHVHDEVAAMTDAQLGSWRPHS